MQLAGRSLVSINDLSNEEIKAVLDLAEEMNSALERGERLHLCEGKELYTLFYEPSTRTRSSFETAMHRLGGTTVSHAEAQTTSSTAKGETIADTVRVLEKYADIIVMRHPLDGSVRLAAEYASIPVLSGGDGAHEHPTQTLLDLYTIRKEKGSIRGKNVALCGDLRHARTVHSLAYALARLGAELTCIAPPGFELPNYVREILQAYGCRPREYSSLEEAVTEGSLVVYREEAITRRRWPARSEQEGFMNMLLQNIDVLYFTRLQRERLANREKPYSVQESYRINKTLLKMTREDVLIMHPLPRTNELAYEVDQDRRAAYFRQAGYGVPVRMALIALFLGSVKVEIEEENRPFRPQLLKDISGLKCPNERCVVNREAYAQPKFYRITGLSRTPRCFYCDYEVVPQ